MHISDGVAGEGFVHGGEVADEAENGFVHYLLRRGTTTEVHQNDQAPPDDFEFLLGLVPVGAEQREKEVEWVFALFHRTHMRGWEAVGRNPKSAVIIMRHPASARV